MPTGVYPRTEYHRNRLKQIWQNPQYREKMSKAHLGNPGYWKGKKLSKNHKRKLSISHLGKFGKQSSHWQNGEIKDKQGYVHIYMPSHPRAKHRRYVKRAVLTIEKKIGRYLLSFEHCHHINGIKDDDKPENLMAFTSNSAHRRFHGNSNNVKPSEIIFDGHKL